MIPQGFIQDLLARADIVDVVGRAVQLKKAGINYKGLCPFHGEKSPSFVVSPSRQTYHCFGCGVHGNAVGFLMEHSGLGFVEAVKELAGEMGLTVPDDDRDPRERERAEQARQHQRSLTEVLARAGQHYRTQLRQSQRAIDYLKGRGLTGEIAKQFGLGYAPGGWHALASAFGQYDDPQLVEAGLVIVPEDGGEQRRYDRFRDRIMFPIRNPKGEVIGFGGRVLDKGEPKYLNSPETPVFSKGRELYGLFEGRAAIRKRGYILVTEGYMDVVALAQWGFGNAVATLGTACTGDHISKMLRFSEHIVFSFDGDAAGRRAAGRALEAVLPHVNDTRSFRFLFLPPEDDPDSFIRVHGAEAFEAQVQQALPLSRQLRAVASEGCDLGTPEGRARMLAQAKPLFELLPEGLLKAQLLGELAREGEIAPETLLHHWSSGQGRGEARRRAAAEAPANAPGSHASTASAPDWHDVPWSHDTADHGQGGHSGYAGFGAHTEAAVPAEDPNDLGYDPMDDGTPPQERWRKERWGGGKGGKGQSPGASRGPWPNKNRAGGWGKHNADLAPPKRRPLRTATSLDQAAWFLAHNMGLWLDLPNDIHDLLVQQASPHGDFFAALERLLDDEGALPLADVLAHMEASPPETGMAPLIARLKRLIELGDNTPQVNEMPKLIDQLRLDQAMDESKLLSESGLHTPEDKQRFIELNKLIVELKTRLTRREPV